MKGIDSYIIEKLHLNKDIEVESDKVKEDIEMIINDFLSKQKLKYDIDISETKDKFIQVNIIFKEMYKQNLVDGWCVELCNKFEKELDGYFWSSRSTEFDNPKQSIIVIKLGKIQKKTIKL